VIRSEMLKDRLLAYLEQLKHERNIAIYELESAPDVETMLRLSGRLRKIEDVIIKLNEILEGEE
jgi:hypothetical protein